MSDIESNIWKWLKQHQYQIVEFNLVYGSGSEQKTIPIHVLSHEDKHVWVDFKKHEKRAVNKRDMQSYEKRFVEFQREYQQNKQDWYPEKMLLFSQIGFTDNAISWAERCGIECLELKGEGIIPSHGGQSSKIRSSRGPDSAPSLPPPAPPQNEISTFFTILRWLIIFAAVGVSLWVLFLKEQVKSPAEPKHLVQRKPAPEQRRPRPTMLRNKPKKNSPRRKPPEKRSTPGPPESHRLWQEATLLVKNGKFGMAAELYQRMQSVPFPLVPTWHLEANEAWAWSKARQILRATQLLEKSKKTYRQWKKHLKASGGHMSHYVSLSSHHAYARVHWALAQVTTGKERLRHLGEIWLEYEYSPLAGVAQPLWWKGLFRVSASERPGRKVLYHAAKRYAGMAYRKYDRAKKLLRFITKGGPRHWQRTAHIKGIDIAVAQKRWAYVLRLTTTFRRRYSKRKDRRKRDWALRFKALAAYHTQGLRGFHRFFPEIKSSFERKSAYYTLALTQLKAGHDDQARESLTWLFTNAKGWRRFAARWYLGLLAYKLKRYTKALETWRQLSNDATSKYWQIRLLYWVSRAAHESGNAVVEKEYAAKLCNTYPLSYYGLSLCKARGFPFSIRKQGAHPWVPTPALLSRLRTLRQPAAKCLELRRQIFEEPKPPPGLVEQTASCLAGIGEWKVSFHMLVAHRLEDIWSGQVGRDVLQIMFPRPKSLWPTIQRVATEKGLDPFLAAAIVLREGDFVSERKYAARVGLMGLDPVWSRKLPMEPKANLSVGLSRLKRLIRQLGPMSGVSAYRGYERDVFLVKRANPRIGQELTVELGPYQAWLYARSPLSGVLWYHLMYKSLYGK